MKYFAPANKSVGLHWHHFGQPILPPIIETPQMPKKIIKTKIIVYLPFEDTSSIITLLAQFKDFEFHIYAPEVVLSKFDHIICNPLSAMLFKKIYMTAPVLSVMPDLSWPAKPCKWAKKSWLSRTRADGTDFQRSRAKATGLRTYHEQYG